MTKADYVPVAATPKTEFDPELDSIDLGPQKSSWGILITGAVLGAIAMWGAGQLLDSGDDANAVTEEVVELATTPARIETLTEDVEWAGTLGYGDAVVIDGSGGTVTDAANAGDVLTRGDALVSVDNETKVLFYGDIPFYRTLGEGTEGSDVRILETNLVALGYDPDVTVTIDNDFTYNTGLMVERWQTDLGNEETAQLALGAAFVVPGPVSVSAVASIGQQAGANLASLEPRRIQTDLISDLAGVVDDLVAQGTAITNGLPLFTIDGLDLVALTELDSVSRVLTGDTYSIEALERALRTAGFDDANQMTIDSVATAATSAALERWQVAEGLPVNGAVDPGYYLSVPTGQIIDSHNLANGDATIAGRMVMTSSASELSVVVTVSVSDEQEFFAGQSVQVTLADESDVEGVVTSIGAVTQDAGNPTIDVIIGIVAGSDSELVEGPVTVTTISSEVVDALVIPTRALVTLREGGYAVEISQGSSTRLVAVELGSFDDGLVEIVSGDIAAGDEVVVPQ
jgi:peptidoglycan hydrolase-like protein with peptidoglycan-binding domain